MFNLLSRNNDLSNFFWPLLYYTKHHLLTDHTLPFWNTMFLSGTPLLPDPQSPLFYPLNLVFLVLPINVGLLLLIFLHLLLGAIGIFVICRKVFHFKPLAATCSSLLFLCAPKIAAFLEAGHVGLIYSFCFMPFVLLATLNLAKKPSTKWSIILAISSALIFLSHPITFALTIATSIIIFVYLIKSFFVRRISFFLLGLLLTSGLIAISALPQIDWSPQTNRLLLLQVRDTYPKWISIREFLTLVFFPWSAPTKNFWTSDTEKILYLGIVPTLLAGYGFIKLKNFKIALTLLVLVCLLISLNNLSPIYLLLIKIDFFALMRIATRVWFIPFFIVIFLAGFGVEKLIEVGFKKSFISILILLALIDYSSASFLRLQTPVESGKYLSQSGINFLKKDQSLYRVFCLTKCISQQQAAIDNIELVEGYSTLIQKNYYQESWQLTGEYWNYYSLSVPPIGVFTLEKLKPDYKTLGQYNTKYIISPYELDSNDIKLATTDGNFYIYQNNLFKERAGENSIATYTPNFIRVNIRDKKSKQLTLSLVYNSGWKASLNGQTRVPVQQTPNGLSLVDITQDTAFVDFKYQPTSYLIGQSISLITLLIIACLLINNLKAFYFKIK